MEMEKPLVVFDSRKPKKVQQKIAKELLLRGIIFSGCSLSAGDL
jgi:hypothetical protein